MSRRWLLSLCCLCVLFGCFVQLTRADGELRVDETRTRIFIGKEPIEVLLAVENSSGRLLNARIQLELLDPHNRAASQISVVQPVGPGSQTLSVSLPISFSKFTRED